MVHQQKPRSRNEIYTLFRNQGDGNILDDIIKREHGSRLPSMYGSHKTPSSYGSEKLPIESFVAVPDPYLNPAVLTGTNTTRSNPLYSDQTDGGKDPYIIPITVTEEKPNGTARPVANGVNGANPRPVYTKLRDSRPSSKRPRSGLLPGRDDLTASTKDIKDVYDPNVDDEVAEDQTDLKPKPSETKPQPATSNKPKPNITTEDDGSVTIHIDNLSPQRSFKVANPSAKSTQSGGSKSPERRDSEGDNRSPGIEGYIEM